MPEHITIDNRLKSLVLLRKRLRPAASDLDVFPVEIDERASVRALANGGHLADQDVMGSSFEDTADLAIEGGDRIVERRRAGFEQRPLAELEALRHRCLAAEEAADIFMFAFQHVDAKHAIGVDGRIG